MSNVVLRKNLLDLEETIQGMPQLDLEVIHHFAHGTYTRELRLPADTIMTGHIHRYSCVNIISEGHIKVTTEDGEREIKGPFTFISGAGIKKACYVFTDTIWITVHPWIGEHSIELIENHLMVPSFEALEAERKGLLT
jgi:hypothetical protein